MLIHSEDGEQRELHADIESDCQPACHELQACCNHLSQLNVKIELKTELLQGLHVQHHQAGCHAGHQDADMVYTMPSNAMPDSMQAMPDSMQRRQRLTRMLLLPKVESITRI